MTNTPPSRPKLAITMGDPAGIGPEIILGLFHRPEFHRHFTGPNAWAIPFVVGEPEHLDAFARLMKKLQTLQVCMEQL